MNIKNIMIKYKTAQVQFIVNMLLHTVLKQVIKNCIKVKNVLKINIITGQSILPFYEHHSI